MEEKKKKIKLKQIQAKIREIAQAPYEIEAFTQCRTQVEKVWIDVNGHKIPILNECGELCCSVDAYEATFRAYNKLLRSIPGGLEGNQTHRVWYELVIQADALSRDKKGKPVLPKFPGMIIVFHHLWNDANPIQTQEHYHFLLYSHSDPPEGAKEIKRHNLHLRVFKLLIRNPFMLILITENTPTHITYKVLSAPLLSTEKSSATYTVPREKFANIFTLAAEMKSKKIYQLRGLLQDCNDLTELEVKYGCRQPLSSNSEKDEILHSMMDEYIEWKVKLEQTPKSEKDERKAIKFEINLLKKYMRRVLGQRVCDICGTLMEQRPATQEEQIQLAPSIPET